MGYLEKIENLKILKFLLKRPLQPSMNASAVTKMPFIGYKSDISQFLVTHLL